MNDRPSPFPTADDRARSRAAKRMALLEAAVTMFNERGFHATSLDDVAASLGVSKPTIYHYLGNKDQVLIECLKIGVDDLMLADEEARTVKGDGADRLTYFLQAFGETILRPFSRCVVRTGEECLSKTSAEELRAMKLRVHHAMCALIREGMADGSIACADPNVLAFTLAGALNWPARWYDPAHGASPSETVAQIVAHLREGYRPRA
ncbi:TetR/AcrR family transcriptional regulator [Croceicoccus naphthovorans]|uniref:TetR family transcriptional regulator n=1 Tax=Croceicoccus naphthovorans TaxID=1348774 RepID=A0A0G3XFT2_9SPHN|nr:TetR/AcrR family transcriptional regulator [Croceicoccus naphthovorans]AKM09506.1 TetR family transcriptional regulator [Croceicoccus naphthovorans]MBB3989756.1 AcrR family transcriptional regulator [Croceicoccus naphthovorans]